MKTFEQYCKQESVRGVTAHIINTKDKNSTPKVTTFDEDGKQLVFRVEGNALVLEVE